MLFAKFFYKLVMTVVLILFSTSFCLLFFYPSFADPFTTIFLFFVSVAMFIPCLDMQVSKKKKENVNEHKHAYIVMKSYSPQNFIDDVLHQELSDIELAYSYKVTSDSVLRNALPHKVSYNDYGPPVSYDRALDVKVCPKCGDIIDETIAFKTEYFKQVKEVTKLQEEAKLIYESYKEAQED